MMALRKQIAVVVPSTSTTLAADFQLATPRGVTIQGQRLSRTSRERLAAPAPAV